MSVRATIEGFYGGDAPLSLAHLLDRYRDEARADAFREAAAHLRRTPRDSRDYPAALTGARIIEADLIDPDKEN